MPRTLHVSMYFFLFELVLLQLELIGDFYEDLHVLILQRSGLEHCPL